MRTTKLEEAVTTDNINITYNKSVAVVEKRNGKRATLMPEADSLRRTHDLQILRI